MRKFIVLASLAALLPVGACGSAADRFLAFFGAAAPETALPVFNDGASKLLGLKNLANQDALVYVGEYFGLPGCGVGTPVTVPGNGELRLNVAFLSGWIHVETRDPLTLDPVTGLPTNVATTGHVQAYLAAERTTQDAESMPACNFALSGDVVRTTPVTDEVTLFNRSYLPMGGGAVCQAADFTAWYYDSAGDPIGSLSFTVLASSFFTIPLGPLAGGGVGQIYVTPDPFPQTAAPGTVFNFALATMEDEDLAYQNGLPFRATPRPTRQMELPLTFGRDPFGNYVDFAMAMTNASDSPTNVALNSMRGEGGEFIKSLPRIITLPARGTRWFATTETNSVGLESGEVHPFADLFGDVFLETTLKHFHVSLSVPGDVAFSARVFEPGGYTHNRTVRPAIVSHGALVSDVVVQSSTASATRNWVHLMNPNPNSIEVFIRGFTPQQGTGYDFPSVMIPAGGMRRWSPDGINVSENSAAAPPIEPRVPLLSFLLSSGAGFGVEGMRERRDGANFFVFTTPLIVTREEDLD
jgi:hypothetical protein